MPRDASLSHRLRVVPCSLREANAFVLTHHRHHDPARGCKFTLAVADDADVIRGIALVGRPVSRHMDDGWTLEVNRVATDGARNACSMLYGAAWRAAKAIGYKKLITYTLPEDGGASLRAAGYICIGESGGGKWSRTARPRIDTHPTQIKLCWQASA